MPYRNYVHVVEEMVVPVAQGGVVCPRQGIRLCGFDSVDPLIPGIEEEALALGFTPDVPFEAKVIRFIGKSGRDEIAGVVESSPFRFLLPGEMIRFAMSFRDHHFKFGRPGLLSLSPVCVEKKTRAEGFFGLFTDEDEKQRILGIVRKRDGNPYWPVHLRFLVTMKTAQVARA